MSEGERKVRVKERFRGHVLVDVDLPQRKTVIIRRLQNTENTNHQQKNASDALVSKQKAF